MGMQTNIDRAYFKSYLKPDFHDAYDAFADDLEAGDDDLVWIRHYNRGDWQDHSLVPFVALTSSDSAGYCIQNGYFNVTAFTDEIVNAPAAELLDFLDRWCEVHDQIL
jgi:hypothetical protein